MQPAKLTTINELDPVEPGEYDVMIARSGQPNQKNWNAFGREMPAGKSSILRDGT